MSYEGKEDAGGVGADGELIALALQPDGKIVIGGDFTSYNADAAVSDRAMRLNADGTRDTTFNAGGAGADGFVEAVAAQPDGKIVIGGAFTSYNGNAAASDGVMRLDGDLFVTWLAGDATDRVIQLPIVKDGIPEGDETLTLALTVMSGGATLGFPDSSTLTIHDGAPTPTPTPTPTPAMSIQFSSATFNTVENVGSTIITVSRSGDASNPASVDFSTNDTAGANLCTVVNGQASSRCDYLITLGKLTFAAGETTKNIPIPIIDDVYAEGAEAFTITLSNAVGATLGAPATATLTITDNDVVNGINPIDTASFFVRQHYVDFLNRESDVGGLNFWTNEIASCGADTQCIEVKRINVSAAFFLSIEFQETGYLVYRVYKSGFGDLPGAPVPVRFTDLLRDTQQIGQGVQVGIGNWEAELEANKQAYTLAFVQRADFLAALPNSMTAAEFVDKLNTNASGALSPAERTAQIAELGATPADVTKRSQVLRSMADDSDLRVAEFNKAFVLMQYFGYLRRNPNDAPDADFGGYNFWMGKLNAFGGDFVNAEMVKAFILSGEYRQRFGP